MQNENFTSETFTIVDTKALQIKSLLDFAEALGYVPVDKNRLSRGFKWVYSGKVLLCSAFESLVFMHNDVTLDNIKLIQQVKLQRDKKEPDGVKCQNHMVRLTPCGEELYAHLRSL